jgi:cellulose synthase/poly-beta-1,6-N-acetylglucosamine synthase-like glycosyltransferase
MFEVIVCSFNEPEETVRKCIENIRKAGGTPIQVTGVSPIGKARNLGLRLSKTDHVFFIDTDETVSKDYFRSMMDFFQKCTEDVGGIWSLHIPPQYDPTILQRFVQRLLNYYQRSLSQDSDSIGCGGSCFKRQAIEGLLFDEDIRRGEDDLFCRKVKARGWKLRVAPVDLEHSAPKDLHDWIKSEIEGGIGYVQIGGSVRCSLQTLFCSFVRGTTLSFHYNDPIFFFLYPSRLVFRHAGVFKAFFALRARARLMMLNGHTQREI